MRKNKHYPKKMKKIALIVKIRLKMKSCYLSFSKVKYLKIKYGNVFAVEF